MTTTTRISFRATAPRDLRAIGALDASAGFEPRLRELVRIRASQINGCAFCVDMHSVDAQKAGEHDRRIFARRGMAREPVLRRARARGAGAHRGADAPAGGRRRRTRSTTPRPTSSREDELARLIGVIIAINAWNRVAIGTALQPEALA